MHCDCFFLKFSSQSVKFRMNAEETVLYLYSETYVILILNFYL